MARISKKALEKAAKQKAKKAAATRLANKEAKAAQEKKDAAKQKREAKKTLAEKESAPVTNTTTEGATMVQLAMKTNIYLKKVLDLLETIVNQNNEVLAGGQVVDSDTDETAIEEPEEPKKSSKAKKKDPKEKPQKRKKKVKAEDVRAKLMEIKARDKALGVGGDKNMDNVYEILESFVKNGTDDEPCKKVSDIMEEDFEDVFKTAEGELARPEEEVNSVEAEDEEPEEEDDGDIFDA